MSSLLAFFVTWFAVTTNCHGALEPVPPVYAVWTYRATVIGLQPGLDGSPEPVYSRVQAEELTLLTASSQIAEPEVGDVVAWRVEAVDVAGNRSGEPCAQMIVSGRR